MAWLQPARSEQIFNHTIETTFHKNQIRNERWEFFDIEPSKSMAKADIIGLQKRSNIQSVIFLRLQVKLSLKQVKGVIRAMNSFSAAVGIIGIGSAIQRLECPTNECLKHLPTKAHCSMTVHGLRTIGLRIGGLTIAMIGLRIGRGMMIRCGIGLPSLRPHCRHRLRRLLLRQQWRKPHLLRPRRQRRTLRRQSLPALRDWHLCHLLIRLLMIVSLPRVAARRAQEARVVREQRAQALRVNFSLEH